MLLNLILSILISFVPLQTVECYDPNSLPSSITEARTAFQLAKEIAPCTLFSPSDSLTVYIFLLDECVISQFYTPPLIDFYKKYNDRKVGFIGYFPNFQDNPDKIEAFGKKYGLPFPLEQDHAKEWTKKFGMTVTPEVAVWDHRTERLLYRGRIDDSYVRVGKRKLHPQHHELRDIIEGWLKGETSGSLVTTQAIGCYINFNMPLEK